MAKTRTPLAPSVPSAPSLPMPTVGDPVLFVALGDYGDIETRAALVAAVDGESLSLHIFPAAADAYRLTGVGRDESGKTVGTWRTKPA